MVSALPKIDKKILFPTLLKIVNKRGEVVPFNLNRTQAYINEYKINRNIILKYRQGGVSSYFLADQYTDAITILHTPCAVISHEGRATQRLLDRVHFFHDTMEEPRPEVDAYSRNEISFPEMHSSVYIGTAGARAFGRGDTISKALLSELAYYEDGEKLLIAVEDAVPLDGELNIECYDEETEVLTDRGWLYFKDIESKDKILTKNEQTNKAYWTDFTHKIERDASELIQVRGKGVDFAVTPNHNIWARKNRTIQTFQVYQAKELFEYSEWEFESGMDWEGEEKLVFFVAGKPVPAELWLEFFGFFLSEGWVGKYQVSIYQEGEYQHRFREVAGLVALYLDKELGVYDNGRCFTIPGKSFADYLRPYTKPKRIPKTVLNLPKRQLQVFLKAYMMGDGEKKRNRCVTVDIPLRDGLQEIGLKLGYRTNFITKKAFVDKRGVNHRESYVMSFYKRKRASVRQARGQIERVSYVGKVYCVTLPKDDHFLMVRRKGKAVWLQNCTPNGEDNIFYDRWVKAREGKSPYKPFFFPWWWCDDYQIPANSEYALVGDKGVLHLTKEELDLISAARSGGFELTEDQIRWRRWKIAEKGGLFWQEFPEDEVSCWITVGDPVFDQLILNDLASKCCEGEHHSGGWNFWIPPAPKDKKIKYIIGADTSAGAPEGSYSAAVVLDSLWNVCATFQARLEPHNFATILRQLGKCYNDAEIVIERNFTGYAVLEQLQDYPNIAHQRDFTTGKITTQKGWWSNDQTRDLLMTVTKENLGQCKIWDVNLVRQLRSYRYIKLKRKFREQAQTYDDLAIAFMLAVTSRKVAGVARGYQGKVPGYSW